MKPVITEKDLSTCFESKFLNVYDFPFGTSGHYYTASRRKRDDLVMLKDRDEYRKMLADAVTIAVIADCEGEAPRLLLNYEFRYAAAEYILAPPAGLIDKEDKEKENPLIEAAIREVYEETGITVAPDDRVFVVNPLLFSSPGMTDESNAIVCAVLNNPDLSKINHDGTVGAEVFEGFELVTIDEAREILKNGRDKFGNYYSVYTYVCLMYFVSQMWK